MKIKGYISDCCGGPIDKVNGSLMCEECGGHCNKIKEPSNFRECIKDLDPGVKTQLIMLWDKTEHTDLHYGSLEKYLQVINQRFDTIKRQHEYRKKVVQSVHRKLEDLLSITV